jgi:3-(methylthio)propanoyl-CoA dehydrogenase
VSDFTAPVIAQRFALEHIADIGAVAGFPDFSEFDPSGLDDLLAEAGRFVAEVLAPLNRIGDTVGAAHSGDGTGAGTVTMPPGFVDAYRRFVDSGWSAAPFEPEYGGGGLPWSVNLAVQEMITAANMAFSLCPLLTQGAIHLLGSHASEEQRQTYLPKMITGEWTGTMNLTEPHAGSDVGALTAKAVRQPDGTYRISGQKIFITYGEHDLTENIIHLVLARTPDAPPGTRGISCFIVPKYLVAPDGSVGQRNDLTCVSIEHKLGIHASPTCVLQFGERDGAIGFLIGDEGSGMRAMFTMMNNARLSVGVQGLAIAERSYQQALAFASERRQGRAPGAAAGVSSPIIEHADVRRMLLTMRALIDAMRGICYLTAAATDTANHGPDVGSRAAGQELADLLTPIAKGWSTDMGTEAASLGIQVHGGMGFIEETGAAQHYRDIRIAAIYEGTNGIQAIDLVTRKLGMRGGAVVRELLDRIGGECTGVSQMAGPLHAVREATEWLIAHGDRPDDLLAGATPYLRMMGIVTGGWLIARGAGAARGLLQSRPDGSGGSGGYDASFLEARIAAAEFYLGQILPTAMGLLPSVTAGARALDAVGCD